MKNTLYAVIQEGVYRHGIFGIFDDKLTAIDLAKKLAQTDSDSWHAYQVRPYELSIELKSDMGNWHKTHDAIENDVIFDWNKNRANNELKGV